MNELAPPAATHPGRTDWHEPDRLAALLRYGILDTPPEPDFDHITRVASLVCKTPISVINIIADTRQWFKAEIGLGIRETPLDVSICARALLQPDVLVVPDLSKDPMFDCNPLVTGEPHLRFYAGARLNTPEGLPLGTVCVLDYEPRPEGATEEQLEVLRALSRQAMAQFELRRALQARELLAQELSHRIKNIFAVVGSLATATARGNDAAKGFASSFTSRLGALAKAHDFVLVEGSAAARRPQTVKGLLEILLAPYRETGRERFIIDGDDAPLGSSAATALALIVHEQATNAAKYGALSNPTGQVSIRSQVKDDVFTMAWDERGGPAVTGPPARQGFGSLIVGRTATGQLGGGVTYTWAREGLSMVLTAKLSALAR